MPRRPEQFEAIREKSREKILSASLELFARNGYDSTSMDSIAKKAHISKGLIYNYYKSKKSILVAIFEDALEQGEIMVARQKDTKDPGERMRAHVEDMFAFMKSNPEYIRVLFSISLQPGVLKNTRDIVDKMFKKNMEMMDAIYSGGNKRDAYTGLMLDALLDGIILGYIRYGDKYPVDLMKQKIIEQYCPLMKKVKRELPQRREDAK